MSDTTLATAEEDVTVVGTFVAFNAHTGKLRAYRAGDIVVGALVHPFRAGDVVNLDEVVSHSFLLAGPRRSEKPVSDDDTISLDEVYADLVGVTEVADNLGVGIHRVKRWIERRATTNCPKPVRKLKQGHVYSMAEWKGWFALWRITRGSETWNRAPGATAG